MGACPSFLRVVSMIGGRYSMETFVVAAKSRTPSRTDFDEAHQLSGWRRIHKLLCGCGSPALKVATLYGSRKGSIPHKAPNGAHGVQGGIPSKGFGEFFEIVSEAARASRARHFLQAAACATASHGVPLRSEREDARHQVHRLDRH